MITVTLYTRAGCELCKQAEEDLKTLQEEIPHQLAILDIDSDPSLRDTFALEIPVVEAGPFRLKAPFTRQELQMTLGAAADRRLQLENINDKTFQVNTSRTQIDQQSGQNILLDIETLPGYFQLVPDTCT